MSGFRHRIKMTLFLFFFSLVNLQFQKTDIAQKINDIGCMNFLNVIGRFLKENSQFHPSTMRVL